jgi:hypothetical protein
MVANSIISFAYLFTIWLFRNFLPTTPIKVMSYSSLVSSATAIYNMCTVLSGTGDSTVALSWK